MSKVLIGQYLIELVQLRQVSGSSVNRWSAKPSRICSKATPVPTVCCSFRSSRSHPPHKERRRGDGTLLHALRLLFGYWKAKDEQDDRDAETNSSSSEFVRLMIESVDRRREHRFKRHLVDRDMEILDRKRKRRRKRKRKSGQDCRRQVAGHYQTDHHQGSDRLSQAAL
ncbi:MAG: hypothetical protein J0M09_17080 [Xanthomonadales bacterium]|nr:hypothetical protein [Xanthomonadales bacterium]